MTHHLVKTLVPVAIQSEANGRDHWRTKARRAKLQRQTARLVLQQYARPMHDGPVMVTLTRIGRRKLDDDNLAGGFKAVRDGVADWLGIDDGSPRMTWVYVQRTGEPGAEVAVEWETACAASCVNA